MDKIWDLLQKAKDTTESPGVYLMKSKTGVVLYVGKAKNLKNRLKSYFQPKIPKTTKTTQLVNLIEDFEIVQTLTEQEALALELNLIQKYQPKYNIKLKNSGGYPFIKIDFNKEAPFLEWQFTNKNKDKNVKYFGPYPSVQDLKEVIDFLNNTFKLRTCNEGTYRFRSRPCLLFQINKCSAPCTKEISLKDYNENLKKAIEVLEGKSKEVIKDLTSKMEAMADKQLFEQAAELRDRVNKIKQLTEKQSAINPNSEDSFLVAEVLLNQNSYILGFLEVEKGKIQGFKFLEDDLLENLNEEEILKDFFYKYKPEEEKVIYSKKDLSYLNANNQKWITIKDLWHKNLMSILEKNLQNTQPKLKTVELSSLEEIKTLLNMEEIPLKIECVDISNLQGTFNVGSKVCFLQGRPEKSEYRKYKIKTVQGANDFASIKEVIKRRFSKEEESFPQLMVIDGGIEQLKKALEALEELQVQGVTIVGLAKDKTLKDFKSQEIKTKGERIILPSGQEILLTPGTVSYRVLTSIRNEAHRFALKFHRELRSKNYGLKNGN